MDFPASLESEGSYLKLSSAKMVFKRLRDGEKCVGKEVGKGDRFQNLPAVVASSVSVLSQSESAIHTKTLKRKRDCEESDQLQKKPRWHEEVVANPTQPEGSTSRVSSALASSMSAGHSQRSGKSSIIHVCRKRKREEESQQLQKKWKLDEEDARHGYEDTSGPCVTLPASYKPLRSLKLPKSVFSDEGESKRDESNILRDPKKRKSPGQLDSEHPQKKQRFNPEHNCDGRPYTQGHLLGEGGFGSVYAGNRISDGLKVAIKYVSKDLIDEQLEVEGQGLLPIEVALMIRVNSDPACPNILHLIEWFETPEEYIMILERPDPCKDLDKFCYEQGNLEESQAKRVLVQLIRALKHCESKGVLHRDVKPQNILIRTDTHDIKLLDFGCGDLLNDSDYKMFAGTLDYFPPEWYRYRSYRAGPATVWSVGVTLYNILCGTLPFKNKKDILRGRLRFTRDLSIGKTGLTLNCP